MGKNGTNILLKDIYINPWKYKSINCDLVSLLNLSLGNVDFVFIESNGRSQILNTDTSNDLLLSVFQEFEEKYDHKESVLEDNFKGRKILDLNNLNIPKDLHVAILEELKKFDDSIIEQCADRLKSSITKQQNFEKINFPKEIEKHLRGIASVDIEANVISKNFKHRIDLKIKQFESSEGNKVKPIRL